MQPWEILDKFTGHLRDSLARAIAVATEVGATRVSPLHLLYALSLQKGSVAHEILSKNNVLSALLEPYVKSNKPAVSKDNAPAPTVTIPELTPKAKRALEKAMLIASDYEHTHVGTEHLLSGLLKIEDKKILSVLEEKKIATGKIQTGVDNIMQSTSRFPDLGELEDLMEDDLPSTGTLVAKGKNDKKKRKMLDYFAVELTDPQVQEGVDPVIGRDAEIDRLIHILSRRTKNNPVLLGDPGVGKTAIVEGLAKRILAQRVPDLLLSKRIYALDIGLLIAGTIYRGEFESRIKNIIDEVSDDQDAIVFIDELHTIVGTGASQGSLDAANILKPALARGQLRAIGATTVDEYKKHIENDPALERRFQSVFVAEPTVAKTVQILEGIKHHYEQFHKVTITRKAIRMAADLSATFIADNKLPDKAIDVIDEAAAAARISKHKDKRVRIMHEIKQAIEEIRSQKEDAVYQEQFDKALDLKKQEQHLQRQLKRVSKEPVQAGSKPRITAMDIAKTVASMSGVPAEHILRRGQERYDGLSDFLGARVIGQNQASAQLQNHLRAASVGLTEEHRPLTTLLFIGPSGVGKTEMAKSLASFLYPDRNALLRVDMSEFSEGFGVSKLLGAPAGYVGYKESTPVLDKLRHQPHSIVVFDNVDKGHPDVLRLLLQIAEEGELTTSRGKTISFKQAIVILTMAAETSLFDSDGIGFSATAATSKKLPPRVYESAKDILGDELLGRLDAVVPFAMLSQTDLHNIFTLHVEKLNDRLKKQGRTITVDQAVISHLLTLTKPRQGARMTRSLIAEHLTHPLARGLKEDHKTIRARLTDDGIILEH